MFEQIEEFIKLLESLGIPGIFFISLLGSMIPFLPLPYLALVVIVAKDYDGINLVALGLAAGAGGSIGKLTTYAIGALSYKTLPESKRKELKTLSRLIKKYGVIAIFIFALTPLPDDVLYFPLGLSRFDIRLFLLANMAGKILLAIGVAFLAKFYHGIAKSIIGEEMSIYSTIIAIIAMIIITIILLRVNWIKAIEIARSEGIRSLFKMKNLKEILRKSD